jgi:hypothetical protein
MPSCAWLCHETLPGASSIRSRRSSPAAMLSSPAPWMSHGAGPARPRPPRTSRSVAPNATAHPPSTTNPATMIHGSRASGAASPAIPAAAPNRAPIPLTSTVCGRAPVLIIRSGV